ncbi:hypothetical protein TNCV_4877191 [Trichonephila clavipes]|nr:hypothetical protein TNCV_4877191 [Trichonephila clavipes]
MKENRVEPLCTKYKERVQQNSVGQWVGKEGWGSGYSCHNDGWKTLKKSIHGATAFSIKSWTPERENDKIGTCADSTTTCADSRCSRACADSTCPTITCADSSVPCPRATFADSTCSRTTCADSSVTSPTVTCADLTCAYSRCSRTCADSSVTRPTATYADSPRTYADLHVSEPVQIPVSQVPQSPVQIPPVQSLPDLDILDPLELTDAFDLLMSFVFGPQELQLLHTVPSIFDGNLLSFLDEFEREPMDLTMPRLNSCVNKSIGFKPIQPMDLSVNSCL